MRALRKAASCATRRSFAHRTGERRFLFQRSPEQEPRRRTWSEKLKDPLRRQERRERENLQREINEKLEELGVEFLQAYRGYAFAGDKGERRGAITLRRHETDVHAVTLAGHTVHFRYHPKNGWEWKEAAANHRSFEPVKNGNRFTLTGEAEGTFRVDQSDRLGFNQIADRLANLALPGSQAAAEDARPPRSPEEVMNAGLAFLRKCDGAVVRANTAIVPIDKRGDGIRLVFDRTNSGAMEWMWAYVPDRTSATYPPARPFYDLAADPSDPAKPALGATRFGTINAFLEVFELHAAGY